MAKGLSPSWSIAFTSFNALMLQNRQVPWLEAFGRDNPGSNFYDWDMRTHESALRSTLLLVGCRSKGGISSKVTEFKSNWSTVTVTVRWVKCLNSFTNKWCTNRRATRCMSIEPTASLRHSGAWLTCWGSRTRWSLFGPQQWNCERGGAPKYAQIQTILLLRFLRSFSNFRIFEDQMGKQRWNWLTIEIGNCMKLDMVFDWIVWFQWATLSRCPWNWLAFGTW